MKRFLTHAGTQFVLRMIIGGIFMYAGFLKSKEPQSFADAIASFRILPNQLVNLPALALPPFEVLVGFGLVIGLRRRAFALAIIGMTFLFAVALSSAMARGLVVDCGCFGNGILTEWSNWIALGRDVLLLGGALVIYMESRSIPGESTTAN